MEAGEAAAGAAAAGMQVTPALAWMIAIVGASIVAAAAVHGRRPLDEVVLAFLLVLKAAATVLYLIGLDVPIARIALVRGGGEVAGFTLTANLVVLLTLMATTAVLLARRHGSIVHRLLTQQV